MKTHFLPETRRKCTDVSDAGVQGRACHSILSGLCLFSTDLVAVHPVLTLFSLSPSELHGQSFDETNTSVTSQLVESSYFSYQHVTEYVIAKVRCCPISILRKAELTIISDFHLT